MDLSKLSDADLEALASGRLNDVSDNGLVYLSTQPDAVKYIGATGQGAGNTASQAQTQLADIPYSATAEDMSFLDQLAAGAGGAAIGTGLALRQVLPFLDKPTEEEVQDYKAAMEGLRGTGGGMTGEILGNVAQFAIPGGAAMKVPKIASLFAVNPIATIAALGAGEGALAGMLTPVGDGDSRVDNTLQSAALGAAVPIGIKGVQVGLTPAARHIRALASRSGLLNEAGRKLNEAAGTDKDAILAALNPKNNSSLQGRTITSPSISASEIASKAGITNPEFAGLEKLANTYSPTVGSKAAVVRQEGRLKALRQIGKADWRAEGDKGIFGIAMKKREEIANKLYEAARKTDDARLADWTRQAKNMTGGYGTKPAQVAIHPIAKEVASDPVIAKAASLVESQNLAKNPMSSIRGMEVVLKRINDNIDSVNRGVVGDIDKVTFKQLVNAKNNLLEAMFKISPKYKVAHNTYQNMSRPIDRMIMGQELERALANVVEGKPETAAAFFRIVDDVPNKVTKQKLGFEYDKLSDLLTKDEMKIVNRVKADLTASLRSSDQGAKGMASQARKFGAEVQESSLPNFLNAKVTFANNILKRIFGNAKEKTLNEIAEIMQDPKYTALIMEKATKAEQEMLRDTANLARAGSVSAVATNRGEMQ